MNAAIVPIILAVMVDVDGDTAHMHLLLPARGNRSESVIHPQTVCRRERLVNDCAGWVVGGKRRPLSYEQLPDGRLLRWE